MRRVVHGLMLAALAASLTGCVSTAVAIVKAPFQLAGAAWDGLTTSQEEADRNRGRALRKAEEADAKAEKKAEKARKKTEREAARR